ncbi:MAG: hypothetical protein JO165_12605, partial [Candidatus Eremiobacteraeota bacterium]|nr:hypothetical protein [Candidatus Eremiobacteraeota bacterium]
MRALHWAFSVTLGGLAMTITCASSPAAAPDAQIFVQRIADLGRAGTVSAVIDGYPAQWNSPVPLPTGIPLLGTVMHTAEHSVEAYYRPQNAENAYDAYIAQLHQAGFVAKEPAFKPRGFAESAATFHVSLLCRGAQGLNVEVARSQKDDLRIEVLSDQSALNPCTNNTSEAVQVENPLPALVPPEGVTQVASLSGSSNFGYSLVGTSANVSSSVVLQGSNARDIVSRYAREFKDAG